MASERELVGPESYLRRQAYIQGSSCLLRFAQTAATAMSCDLVEAPIVLAVARANANAIADHPETKGHERSVDRRIVRFPLVA